MDGHGRRGVGTLSQRRRPLPPRLRHCWCRSPAPGSGAERRGAAAQLPPPPQPLPPRGGRGAGRRGSQRRCQRPRGWGPCRPRGAAERGRAPPRAAPGQAPSPAAAAAPRPRRGIPRGGECGGEGGPGRRRCGGPWPCARPEAAAPGEVAAGARVCAGGRGKLVDLTGCDGSVVRGALGTRVLGVEVRRSWIFVSYLPLLLLLMLASDAIKRFLRSRVFSWVFDNSRVSGSCQKYQDM